MNHDANLARISVAVDLLEHVPAKNRLLAIQNLCINNGGRWDYSLSLPKIAQPCLYEIQIFGVPAMADQRERLTDNWLRAAKNILEAEGYEASGEAA